tara:strand:- start:944 stop:1729 length:786 start_codon:yes stop_codon:yes gene_type:complete
MSLTGKTKAASYKDLLQVNNSNNGVDATARIVKDGEGTASAINIAEDILMVQPKDDDNTDVFSVRDKDGNRLLQVDSSNDLVKAGIGLHIANTQIQQFGFSSASALPSSTNTWTALPAGQRLGGTAVEFGTGSSPATSLTIASTADDVVPCFFYVPINITIDSCNVWYGADASSGDTVKFSVMSYTVDSSNGATGGDLSSGTENCASVGAVAGAGYEQAYIQNLTVSSADVDAGKVIMAFVHQNGTNADLSVNMQLVYHLR